MKKAFILSWVVPVLVITSAGQGAHAQEQQPAAAQATGAVDVLKMLEEDLAALPDNPAGEDAEHLRRLQRLHELKSEVIVEPAGAAAGRPALGETVAEQDIYELDEEIEMLWKEIADLRRTIKEMNGQSFRDEREQPGITEPIPYDSEPDPSQGEPESAP